jgi:hypothetical protein
MSLALPAHIRQQCITMLDADIRNIRPVGGGDINEARLLETSKGRFFLKLNAAPAAARMFETEAKGLDLLGRTHTLRIPKVIGSGETPDGSFLLMEFVETGYREEGFWEEFGTSLAALHRQTAPQFGLDHANFIGSLPQPNHYHNTWPSFYIHERLQPHLDMALQSKHLQHADARLFEKLYQKLPGICPDEPPALVHGDLWSGNFLVSTDSHPVLVDPSVSYAHREMDLGMSRLFGGFDRTFYRSYEEAWPLSPGFEQRLPVYQLYYLMVHVNLFGGGYAGSVRTVLRQFVE